MYHIPQDLPEGISADDALWHIPKQRETTAGFWIGYIPFAEHYTAIYEAALKRNIRLINSPRQFCFAEEFDLYYPVLADLTAKSMMAESLEACEKAAEWIGYPVFLKGTVQSLKADGVDSCIVHSPEQLRRVAGKLFLNIRKTLGRVIVRQILPPRHCRKGPGNFPLGREYRCFVLHHEVVGLGPYWEGEDALSQLTAEEECEVRQLAEEAGRRMKVPFVAVDIGQLETGEWKVIEAGDGQFSGLSQVPRQALWHRLVERLKMKPQV